MFQPKTVLLALAMLLALASILSSNGVTQANSVSGTLANGAFPRVGAVNPETHQTNVVNFHRVNGTMTDGSYRGTAGAQETTTINTGPGSGPVPGQVNVDQFPYAPAEGLPPLSILPGAEWRYFKGIAEPPVDWTSSGFDDLSWISGPSGFGYGDDDDATILDDMLGAYGSVYLRQTFNVVDPGAIASLLLSVDYDDGFVAYLNGVEVARSNVDGAPPAFDALATASHEASGGDTTVNPVAEFDITSPINLLVAGDNVLALQGHNLDLESSDFSLIPSLLVVPVLAGHWSFDEGSGIIASDASGNGNTGTLENGTAWVPGHLGNAVKFDGINDLVRVLDNHTLDFGVGDDFSISLWFRDSTAGPNAKNASEMLEKQNAYRLYQVRSPNSEGDLRAQIKGGGTAAELFTTAGNLADGQWHHLVFIRDYDDNISAYVDGNPAGLVGTPVSAGLANSADLLFGSGNTGYYDGALDEVRIYRKVLSAEEIATLADVTVPEVTITTPPDGASYEQGSSVPAAYDCTDEAEGSGIDTCVGDVVLGADIDTATLGAHSFTVTGTDTAENATTLIHNYTVISAPLPIQADAGWRYFKGTAEPPVDWTSNGFDDLSWIAGPSGFGYGDDDDATILSDMLGTYASVYLRKTFNVVDPSVITGLLLSIDYDDGFVAYLNGTEVARSNVAGTPPAHDTLATASHEASGGDTSTQPVGEFDITSFVSALVPGENVLALQGHNLTLDSTDFSLIPSLVGVDTVADAIPPVVTISTPSDGASFSQNDEVLAGYDCTDEAEGSGIDTCIGDVAVGAAADTATPGAKSFTVTGTDNAGNSTTLIQNYTVASLPLPILPLPIQAGDEWRYFKGTVEPPANWKLDGFDDLSWDVGPSGIGYSDDDDATVLTDMEDNYTSVYLRKTFSVSNPGTPSSLMLSVDYDDGFVAYLNGTEVGRANVTGSPPAFNALADSDHEASGGVHNDPQPPVQIDITSFANLLVAGDNVLALQGHNKSLSSSDFSLIPTLIGDGDDDGDGIDDLSDLCPGTPTGDSVDANGCSESQLDADGDGVANGGDLCPGTPTGDSVDANGCSESQLDADGDGVANGGDLCPGTPTGDSVDADGCSAIQLNSTMVGYWSFDEDTGDALDSSGNENNGTLESFPLGHAGPMRVTGHLGNAVKFDGINDLVRVADSETLDFGEGEDFSISLWFRDSTAEPNNTGNSPELLEKQSALTPESSPFYQVRSPDATETLKVQVDDGLFQDSFNTTLGGELADGEWHHLVVIRDYDVGISGYIDGILAGSDTTPSAGSLVNDGDLLFGGGNLTGHTPGFYNGELDEVQIYRSALSEVEIAGLFNAQ